MALIEAARADGRVNVAAKITHLDALRAERSRTHPSLGGLTGIGRALRKQVGDRAEAVVPQGQQESIENAVQRLVFKLVCAITPRDEWARPTFLDRAAAVGLIEALARSGLETGVIGIEAGKSLKRLPSNIFWNGLRRWGICLLAGTQDEYHRSLDSFHATDRRAPLTDDHEPVVGRHPNNWHVHLPAAPASFPDEASLALTTPEGRYLRERILATAPGSLLSYFVDRARLSEPVEFPWEHPDHGSLPTELATLLDHARNLSDVVRSAPIVCEPEDSSPATEPDAFRGLHAKLYVADESDVARVWTGSANATDAVFSKNVELLVELTGKRSICGIDALDLDTDRTSAGAAGPLCR